jgi:hypothetical protein
MNTLQTSQANGRGGMYVILEELVEWGGVMFESRSDSHLTET